MADIAPSPSFTKIGNIVIVLLIALAAIYLANNYSTIGNFVGSGSNNKAAA